MYNYSYKLKYNINDDDTKVYQQDYLKSINLETYDYSKICSIMDNLYKKHKKYFDPCIEIIKKNSDYPFALTDIMAFQILFSYDDFVYTHRFLEEIHENPNKEGLITQNDLLIHLKKEFNK